VDNASAYTIENLVEKNEECGNISPYAYSQGRYQNNGEIFPSVIFAHNLYPRNFVVQFFLTLLLLYP
jgi:hypothetical protein